MKKFLIALVCVLFASSAFARFEAITDDVNRQFDRIKGYVISVDGDTIYFDKGFNDTVYNGLEMKIYRESEEIVHPITGEVLGKKKAFVADAVVDNVQEKYSTAKIVKKEKEIALKDLIIYNPPLPVDFQLIKLPTRLKLLLQEELTSMSNLRMDSNAPIKLVFTQLSEGGIKYEMTNKKTGRVIDSKFYSDKDLGGSLSGRVTKDIMRSSKIDKTYKSMAVGHPYKDKEIYIATAYKRGVDLYKFTGEGFDKVGSVKGDFEDIQAVEIMDLNGNGVDEVFVTDLVKNKFMRSSVYEINESGNMALVKDNIPYILRATYSNGSKIMVSQRIGFDGKYLGSISRFEFVNDYQRTDVIPGTKNMPIFGFGFSDFDKDGEPEILSINSENRMELFKNGKSVFKTVDSYSDTPFYFIIEEPGEIKTKNKYTASKDDVFEYLERKRPLNGRIFVNSDNRIYVVKNVDKLAILENTKSYKGSAFASYEYGKNSLHRIWESDFLQPVIVDYYMYEEFGRTYLFCLKNVDRSMFNEGDSELMYIETK